MRRTHVLKTDPHWFDLIADGTKTAEIRKHDRDYQVGDRLVLWRYVPLPFGNVPRGDETTSFIEATISHVLPASVYPEGLQDRYSMISFVEQSAHELDHEDARERYGWPA